MARLPRPATRSSKYFAALGSSDRRRGGSAGHATSERRRRGAGRIITDRPASAPGSLRRRRKAGHPSGMKPRNPASTASIGTRGSVDALSARTTVSGRAWRIVRPASTPFPSGRARSNRTTSGRSVAAAAVASAAVPTGPMTRTPAAPTPTRPLRRTGGGRRRSTSRRSCRIPWEAHPEGGPVGCRHQPQRIAMCLHEGEIAHQVLATFIPRPLQDRGEGVGGRPMVVDD